MELSQSNTNNHIIGQSDVFYGKFKKDGSSDLAIDGTTPVTFTLEDLTSDTMILNRVDFLISTSEAIDINRFGNVATLANGVQFTIDGTQTFKSNGDILMFASDSDVFSARIGATTISIINGHWDLTKAFQNGLVCKKSDLKIIINDNLSAINFFEVSASGVKISG